MVNLQALFLLPNTANYFRSILTYRCYHHCYLFLLFVVRQIFIPQTLIWPNRNFSKKMVCYAGSFLFNAANTVSRNSIHWKCNSSLTCKYYIVQDRRIYSIFTHAKSKKPYCDESNLCTYLDTVGRLPSEFLNVYDFGMKMYTSQLITAQLLFQKELWLVERYTFSCRNRTRPRT